MAATPRLSIGMPVRDNVSFIENAVTSLLSQDFSDFELIVSDNGSTDGTSDVLVELAKADKRIRYVRQKANQGASWNFNETFRLRSAGVPYFKWAAGDDMHRPGYLSATVGLLDTDHASVLAHARTIDIDPQGTELGERGWTTKGEATDVVERFQSFLHRHEAYQGFGVVRTAAMAQTQLLAPYSDSDLTLLAQISLYGRMVNVNEPLFYRRVHDGQSTRTYTTRRGRNAWFDPRRAGQLLAFPAWRMGRDLSAAVMAAPLSLRERRRCLSLLPGWAWDTRLQLANDVVSTGVGTAAAARAVIRRKAQ